MRASSTPRSSMATPAAADADSSCGDSGISGASACASPTQQQLQLQHQLGSRQPFLLQQQSKTSTAADGDPCCWQLTHAMAMSAISEMPGSPSSSSPTVTAVAAAVNSSSSSSNNNNNRLTQSLSYGKGPSAQARRQALAHSLAMLGHETRSRQRELDTRERELRDATAKATEQIEYVLKMTDKAHKFEDENQQLRRQAEVYKDEIGKLLDELQDREAELLERDEELARRDDYCEELRRELGRSRQDIAQIRTRADQLKVENSVLSESRAAEDAGGCRCPRPAAECEELRRSNQRLQRQLAHADSEARRATAEAAEALARAGELAEELRRLAEEQGSDERSKRELLQAIRCLAEDKMAWEAYCARLLRRAVDCAPQLLCQAVASASAPGEGRWEAMFSTLFRAVMQKDPRLADCVTSAAAAAERERQRERERERRPPTQQAPPATRAPHLPPPPTTASRGGQVSGGGGARGRPILPPAMRSARQLLKNGDV